MAASQPRRERRAGRRPRKCRLGDQTSNRPAGPEARVSTRVTKRCGRVVGMLQNAVRNHRIERWRRATAADRRMRRRAVTSSFRDQPVGDGPSPAIGGRYRHPPHRGLRPLQAAINPPLPHPISRMRPQTLAASPPVLTRGSSAHFGCVHEKANATACVHVGSHLVIGRDHRLQTTPPLLCSRRGAGPWLARHPGSR